MATCLFILLLFVLSPFALHMTRMAALVMVVILLAISLLIRTKRVGKFPVETAASLFIVFMVLNASIAIFSGNNWVDALSELVPLMEVFFCFILVGRIVFDENTASKWLRWALWFALARAAWQLLLIFVGDPIIPPIYGQADRFKAEVAVANFSYVRPIDPVTGLFVTIAIILYLFGVHRRLALVTTGAAGAVSLLGLTRSEWIASMVCILMLFILAKRQLLRQMIYVLITIGLAMYALTVAVPDFGEFLQARLIDYTVQQVDAPTDELQQLRILEYFTAAEKFKEAPLLGHGLGSGFGTVVFNGSYLQFVQFHNYYLNLLSNAGLAGMALLAIVAARAARYGVKMYRACSVDFNRAVVVCAIASLLWWGIFIAFQPVYSSYHVTVLVGTLFGMSHALTSRSRPPGIAPCAVLPKIPSAS